MAIVQALLALVSRSLGRIVSAIFGWAVVALFGQTSGWEQIALEHGVRRLWDRPAAPASAPASGDEEQRRRLQRTA